MILYVRSFLICAFYDIDGYDFKSCIGWVAYGWIRTMVYSLHKPFSEWMPLQVEFSLQLQPRKFPSPWRWKSKERESESKIDQGVVKGMSAAMKSMNLEKISTLMDNFEKEVEVIVKKNYMNFPYTSEHVTNSDKLDR